MLSLPLKVDLFLAVIILMAGTFLNRTVVSVGHVSKCDILGFVAVAAASIFVQLIDFIAALIPVFKMFRQLRNYKNRLWREIL